jgi:hypothetical protein
VAPHSSCTLFGGISWERLHPPQRHKGQVTLLREGRVPACAIPSLLRTAVSLALTEQGWEVRSVSDEARLPPASRILLEGLGWPTVTSSKASPPSHSGLFSPTNSLYLLKPGPVQRRGVGPSPPDVEVVITFKYPRDFSVGKGWTTGQSLPLENSHVHPSLQAGHRAWVSLTHCQSCW